VAIQCLRGELTVIFTSACSLVCSNKFSTHGHHAFFSPCMHHARREDWSSASMVNNVLATDPTIPQPGFDLPHRSWSLINHFRTDQGRCLSNLHKWGLTSSDLCACGQQQTMNNMVNVCPLTKFGGWLRSLHEADDDAIHWLEFTAATATALAE